MATASLLMCLLVVADGETAARGRPSNLTRKCADGPEAGVDYFPDKAVIEDATGFSVTYHHTYKVVDVRAGLARERYVLVQCGTPPPPRRGDLATAQFVSVPIGSLYAASSTHLAILPMLGRLDVLRGVASMRHLADDDILRHVRRTGVREFAAMGVIDTERVVAERPALVMLSGTTGTDASAVRQAGIPVAINVEWQESTALGRAEWQKFLALFLNEERAAERLQTNMRARYHALRARAQAVPDAAKPTVMTGRGSRGQFVIAGGRSFVAALIRDAGGRYVWADDRASGTVTVDLEAQLQRGAQADHWINGGGWSSQQAMLEDEPRYLHFRALQTGHVWVYDAATPTRATDYWSRGVARPDLILADLVRIFHPTLIPDHALTWYRQVPAR